MKAASRKRQTTSDVEGTPKLKRGRPKLIALQLRYPPVKDTGDDEDTIARNQSLLSKELERPKPRKDIVLNLSALTFPFRREAVLTAKPEVTVSDLLSTYPERKSFYVVNSC